LSRDNLTLYIQKKAYFVFVINLTTRTKVKYRKGRRLKFCGTVHKSVATAGAPRKAGYVDWPLWYYLNISPLCLIKAVAVRILLFFFNAFLCLRIIPIAIAQHFYILISKNDTVVKY